MFSKKCVFQESILVLKKGQARGCPFFDTCKESWEECLPY